jgi:outer membrane protein assembly factor BamD
VRDWWWVLVVACVLAGCGGPPQSGGIESLPSPDADRLRGQKLFEDGDYVRAIEVLSAFVDAHPGSNELDQVLFLLGRARQETRDNLVAVEDFNRLIRDFPQSPLREQAEFERARCYMEEMLGATKDPESTETALSLLRAYVQRYPQGAFLAEANSGIDACLERLAMKAFLNAKTYLRLKRDPAAAIYLEKALETKPDFRHAVEARAELARVYERMNEQQKARSAWESLLDEANPQRVKDSRELQAIRREAQEGLARLPVPETGDTTR